MSPLNLTKRDSLGDALRPFIISFAICLGVGACCLVGYATHRLIGMEAPPTGYRPRTAEQDDYMREVRQRNLKNLMAGLRGQRRR